MTHVLYIKILFIIILSCVFGQEQSPIYLNCGGPNYTDTATNILWMNDAPYVNTGTTTSTQEAISSTSIPRLYQTKRWASPMEQMTYEIPCMNGEYYILLHFCESESPISQADQRLFNVLIEDVMMLENIDVFKEAGNQKRAAVVQKTAAKVQDGSLTIQFARNVSNPIISGIEVHYLPPQMILSVNTTKGDDNDNMNRMDNRWWLVNENQAYVGRHECSFVQAGTKFYLFGGRESPQRLEIYDYTTDSWSIGAPPPLPFNHFQATEYQGLIWVIGSFSHNGFPREAPAEHVWVYDPGNNVWMQGSAISRPRGSGGLVVYKDKFYLVGGNTIGHAGGFVSWLDEYNPRSGNWKPLGDAPHSRDHFHAVVVGDRLYAAGGRRTARNNIFGDTVAEVDVYDFSTQTWLDSPMNNLPIPRAGTASVVWNGRVLVIGGESTAQSQAHVQVHALDPQTGTWQELAPLSYGRHGMQAIVSGQGIYVTAGSPRRGGGNQRNMEVYNVNNPAGVESVSGDIVATGVNVEGGKQALVKIQHNGSGTQGVFITRLQLSGPDLNDFSILNHANPFLVPHGASSFVRVKNNGTSDNARAWLDVEHSGGKWLIIPLGDSSSASSAANPIATTSSTTTTSTTQAQMEDTHNLAIKSLILVDAFLGRDIYPIETCNDCITFDISISVRAELLMDNPDHVVDRVELYIFSPPNKLLKKQVERRAPYALFGDFNGKYIGRTLEIGEYTVEARAFGKNGQEGPIKSESFRVS